MSREGAEVTSAGRAFQTRALATEKAGSSFLYSTGINVVNVSTTDAFKAWLNKFCLHQEAKFVSTAYMTGAETVRKLTMHLR